MTMLETLSGATDTIWTEAAIVFGLIATVLAFIAFIGTGWAVPIDGDVDPNFEGLGLWHHCGKKVDGVGNEITECIDFMGKVDLPAWFVAVQALVTMGFVIVFIALIILVVFNCCKGCWHNHHLLLAYAVVQIVGVLLLVAGIAVFGIHIQTAYIETEGELKVSWSFILMSVTCGLSTLTLLLAIAQYRHMVSNDPWVAKRFQNNQLEGNSIPAAPSTQPTEELTDARLRDNLTIC